MSDATKVVIVGAGIIGVSVAYQLTVRMGVSEVVLVDPLPPLTLTSDKSTECYRNWWPNRPMIELVNRSVDLFEEAAIESRNAINLSRRGYLFVTADEEELGELHQNAVRITELGAGELRVHTTNSFDFYQAAELEGWVSSPDGADLVLDGELLRHHFPFITGRAVGGLHARRAGWLSAQQYGAWMLDKARERGLVLLRDRVVGFAQDRGRVTSVQLEQDHRLDCESVVIAAGPLLEHVISWLGVDLPISSELHLKVAFPDRLGVVPRDAPMFIWSDPQQLSWTWAEEAWLGELGREELLGEMPPFCHGRPEGGAESPWVLALWEYQREVIEPVFPIPIDPLFGEVVLRGLETMVPGFAAYRDRLPPMEVDGGYYTKTPENLPLIGPVGPKGVVIAGAVSGFGVMVSAAVGELAALYVVGGELPSYADAFRLERYQDHGYRTKIAGWAGTGQI